MPRPRDPEDLAKWLRSYQDWVAELTDYGYYTVAPDGTRVQSTRAGRPVENAVINMDTLAKKCRTVERWLGRLTSPERRLLDHYLAGVPISHLACDLDYETAKGIVRGLPHTIWWRWYEPHGKAET